VSAPKTIGLEIEEPSCLTRSEKASVITLGSAIDSPPHSATDSKSISEIPDKAVALHRAHPAIIEVSRPAKPKPIKPPVVIATFLGAMLHQ
jgi:hypothetical protein